MSPGLKKKQITIEITEYLELNIGSPDSVVQVANHIFLGDDWPETMMFVVSLEFCRVICTMLQQHSHVTESFPHQNFCRQSYGCAMWQLSNTKCFHEK